MTEHNSKPLHEVKGGAAFEFDIICANYYPHLRSIKWTIELECGSMYIIWLGFMGAHFQRIFYGKELRMGGN